MPMYDLLDNSNNCENKYTILYQYARDEPENIWNNSKRWHKQSPNYRAFKIFNNFWGTLELFFRNCEINLLLLCSDSYVVINANAKKESKLLVTVEKSKGLKNKRQKIEFRWYTPKRYVGNL